MKSVPSSIVGSRMKVACAASSITFPRILILSLVLETALKHAECVFPSDLITRARDGQRNHRYTNDRGSRHGSRVEATIARIISRYTPIINRKILRSYDRLYYTF